MSSGASIVWRDVDVDEAHKRSPNLIAEALSVPVARSHKRSFDFLSVLVGLLLRHGDVSQRIRRNLPDCLSK